YDVSSGKECAAVVSDSPAPLELVESFHTQVFGETLGKIQHFHRQQTFLQLGTRAAESRGIDRIDRVDAVLNEDTFTPADNLASQADVAGVIADRVVVVDKGVEQLNACALLQRVATGITDVVEFLAAVLCFKVVPVVTTDESAGITVAQLKIVGALEDLGEYVALVIVQATIIGGPSGCFAVAQLRITVVQPLVATGSRHARADRQLRIQLRFNLPDIEAQGVGRSRKTGQSDSQRQGRKRPSMHFFCHCAAPFG